MKQCFLHAKISALAQLCKANGFDTATYAALLKLRSNVGDLQGQTIADEEVDTDDDDEDDEDDDDEEDDDEEDDDEELDDALNDETEPPAQDEAA